MVRRLSLESAVFAAIAAITLVTRSHSLSPVLHLPDTALAGFFVLGFFVRPVAAFAALFALTATIDVVAIYALGRPGSCFTPAYAMLLPAYGAMWAAGRLAGARLGARAAALPAIAALLVLASFVSELLASGGFYFLSGAFPGPSLARFLPRLVRYFPHTLLATLGWSGLAAAVFALLFALRPALRPAERRA